MATLNLRATPESVAPAKLSMPRRVLLGRQLVDQGCITADQLVRALRLQLSQNAPLGEILFAEGWAKPEDVQAALAAQHGIPRVDLAQFPPDEDLCAFETAKFWLHHGVIPWRLIDGETLIATARPDRFGDVRSAICGAMGPISPVQASEEDITRSLNLRFGALLAGAAERRVDGYYSCRNWRWGPRYLPPLIFVAILTEMAIAPATSFAMLVFLAAITLTMFSVLKLLASLSHLLTTAPTVRAPARSSPLPKVSVMIPLYREREILPALVARLGRLTYPKVLLDVVLVLEENDNETRQILAATSLPPWMRVIEVPAHGKLTTKPRALNYALDFCRGEIIGIWDAEDAPACDQIERVVDRFAEAGEDVVCLQGILDYYNPRTSWRARCFSIEYASWFRVVLPGIARLGLPVPLGGTTVFLRRDKLESLGGWDAHNVTEDADLGMRLYREGYRTEMIDTVTYEEANYRAWPWVKQRSRWLKGFWVTYLVHMRDPISLWRDLGLWRFAGFQAFFLGTLCQFLLAPVLWSFWLLLLGLPHPLETSMSVGAIHLATALFIGAEIQAIIIGVIAVCRADRRFLIPAVPTLMIYFPLGALAAYKAVLELAVAPYYWDKTEHGVAPTDLVAKPRKRDG